MFIFDVVVSSDELSAALVGVGDGSLTTQRLNELTPTLLTSKFNYRFARAVGRFCLISVSVSSFEIIEYYYFLSWGWGGGCFCVKCVANAINERNNCRNQS